MSTNDFVIREGFPALRLPLKKEEGETQKAADGAPAKITEPWIEGDEPLPRTDFWGKENCIGFGNIEKLWNDCRVVFSARTKDDDAAYSAGLTYFLPSQMLPRCALEALVQTIFKAHTSNLEEGVMIPEQSGAEWWTLVLDEDSESQNEATANESNKSQEEEDDDEEGDEVGMHFDADYGLEDQAPNLLIHPRVATVTYLSDMGAPTVVMQRRSPPPNDVEKKSLEGPIQTSWLSHPKIGKHIAFDGRLLHGAPATFFPATTATVPGTQPPSKRAKPACSQRITLLVNVWVNHCPLDAEPLDDEICSQLSPLQQGENQDPLFTWNNPDMDQMTKMAVVRLESSKEDPAGEEEVVICGRLITVKYNPTMQELHKATAAGPLVLLNWKEDALSLEVGGIVEEEEEGNDE